MYLGLLPLITNVFFQLNVLYQLKNVFIKRVRDFDIVTNPGLVEWLYLPVYQIVVSFGDCHSPIIFFIGQNM